DLPLPAGKTERDGSLPRAIATPLTVQLADGLLVTWLAPQATLQMPALSSISFALVDSPPVEQWSLTLTPVVAERNGFTTRGQIVHALRSPTGQLLLAERNRGVRVERASSVALPAVAGQYYGPWANSFGLRFEIIRPTMAPASVEVRCHAGRTVRVRVVAADETTRVLTSLTARWSEGYSSMGADSRTGEVAF